VSIECLQQVGDDQQRVVCGSVFRAPDGTVSVEADHGVVPLDGLPGTGSCGPRVGAWSSSELSDDRGDVVGSTSRQRDGSSGVQGQNAGRQQQEQLDRIDGRSGFVAEQGSVLRVVPGDTEIGLMVLSELTQVLDTVWPVM
jgi:hypothetical protein